MCRRKVAENVWATLPRDLTMLIIGKAVLATTAEEERADIEHIEAYVIITSELRQFSRGDDAGSAR